MDFQAFVNGSAETVRALVSLLVSGLAVVLGTCFIFSGLLKVINHGKGLRQGQSTVGPVLINLGIGSILVQLSFMTDVVIQTIFGEERESPNQAVSYMPQNVHDSQLLEQGVAAAALWIFAIGFISVIRGLVLWNALAAGDRGQSNGWKGFWHIFFGALAINITGVIKMFVGT